MSRSTLLWWLAAVILAVLAGYFSYFSLVRAVPSATGKAEITAPVIVAATDIPARRSISAEELAVKYYPESAIPPDAAVSLEQVIEKMSDETLYVGVPIIVNNLVTPDIVTQELAMSVPNGKTVMAVPINSLLLQNRLVRPGDNIDIIGSFDLEQVEDQTTQRQESIAALQDVEVHAIIAPQVKTEGDATSDAAPPAAAGEFVSSGGSSYAVLLALDIQDALVLRHILDVGGVLDLLLRAPADDGVAIVTPVDSPYLAARYQIGQGAVFLAPVSAPTANLGTVQ